jgi:hypothetical protein
VSPEEVQKQLEENTRLTRSIHTLLVGSPEYQQPGLVADIKEMKRKVEKHDHILVRYGGAVAATLVMAEFIKFLFDYNAK